MTTVAIGTPITTEQAVRAVLSLIDSPMMPTVGGGVGRALHDAMLSQVYNSLSGGERTLLTIALSLWNGHPDGAKISALGSLDRSNRRKVLMILWYRYMGHDLPITELDEAEFVHLFGDKP